MDTPRADKAGFSLDTSAKWRSPISYLPQCLSKVRQQVLQLYRCDSVPEMLTLSERGATFLPHCDGEPVVARIKLGEAQDGQKTVPNFGLSLDRTAIPATIGDIESESPVRGSRKGDA